MNLFEKIFKFFETMFIWGKHRFKRCDNAIVTQRSSICKKCPEWNDKSYFGLGNCKVCGCTRAKWYVPNSSCPLKKWKE